MITPHTFATSPPPIECEVFHTLIFVASSFGGTQNAISLAHGGNPVPWKNWLSTSRIPSVHASAATPCVSPPENNAAMDGAKPKATFTSVQTSSPKHNILFGFTRSPTIPLRNLESPYTMPPQNRKFPSIDFDMPQSCCRPGMAKEKFFRMK